MPRRLILDSGPAFDFFFDRRGVRERAMEHRRRGIKIGIAHPILGEVLGGVEYSGNRDYSWDTVHRGLSKLVLWPFDRNAAYVYGRVYAAMRRNGLTIQQNDLQMAAIALAFGDSTVVSNDSDLLRVPGLHVENWNNS
jgi:tRNA(fMet)-specific endonuclease VapC